jgi:hypothetical protein
MPDNGIGLPDGVYSATCRECHTVVDAVIVGGVVTLVKALYMNRTTVVTSDGRVVTGQGLHEHQGNYNIRDSGFRPLSALGDEED